MSQVDHVPSSAQSSQGDSKLHMFEDNEAVIKMIMKERSPTMRRVATTHRVSLDWLFDRIHFDFKFKIRYVHTKNPLADILTKGSTVGQEFWVSRASHDSSRWCTGSDCNTALINPESPERATTMQTGVTQSFRQRILTTEWDTIDSVRPSK